MKRAKILLTTGLLLAMLTSVQAQHGKRVYVHIAPPKPKAVHVVKSKKMHRDAIWVAGHWKWNGKKYIWADGRWLAPRKGMIYVPGHWEKNRQGWFYIDGHWKKA
ncbi:MAG: YXWGXW repeat-containing protein [Deferribacteres bacterium]|nr:YXWGXW repeat-containing protein [candidate division KSB1 bacterium]MCB9511554.1 YXWGXW repeat-containing protein [Deferribacteres bacterium]